MSYYHNAIKYIRAQVEDCVVVEFVNGSRACSCGIVRGTLPNLRLDRVLDFTDEELNESGDPEKHIVNRVVDALEHMDNAIEFSDEEVERCLDLRITVEVLPR